jgi:Cu/Ag efflux protein CusF
VELERDLLQEDFEGAVKKIDQLNRKIELQEDDLKKLEKVNSTNIGTAKKVGFKYFL